MKFTYEGTFKTGVNSEKYKENYDRIFRKEEGPSRVVDRGPDLPCKEVPQGSTP